MDKKIGGQETMSNLIPLSRSAVRDLTLVAAAVSGWIGLGGFNSTRKTGLLTRQTTIKLAT